MKGENISQNDRTLKKNYILKSVEYFQNDEPRKIYGLKCLVKIKEGKWTKLPAQEAWGKNLTTYYKRNHKAGISWFRR